MEYINYIKPELLILIPVLIIAGKLLKRSESVKGKTIPLVIGVFSVVLSCLWVLSQGAENIASALFTAFIQGVLCAGAAVYGNQLYKQGKKDE